MFTAPTAIRAIQREDPEARGAAKHDLSSLRQVPSPHLAPGGGGDVRAFILHHDNEDVH